MRLLSEFSLQATANCNDCFVDRLTVASDYDMREEVREDVQRVLLHYFAQINEFVFNHDLKDQEKCDNYITSIVTSLEEALSTLSKRKKGQTVLTDDYYHEYQLEIITSELCNKLIGETEIFTSTTLAVETKPIYVMFSNSIVVLSNDKDNSKQHKCRQCDNKSNVEELNMFFYLQPEVYIKWKIALEVIYKSILASVQRQNDDSRIELAHNVATVDLFVAMIYTVLISLQQKEEQSKSELELPNKHAGDVIQPHSDMYVQHLAWVLTLLAQFLNGQWCTFEEKIADYNNNDLPMANKNINIDKESAKIDCKSTHVTITSALVAGKKLFSFVLVQHVIIPFAHVISKRMYSVVYREKIDRLHEKENDDTCKLYEMELHTCQAMITELKEWSMLHFSFNSMCDVELQANASKERCNEQIHKDESEPRWLANEVVRQIMHEALMQLTQILIEHADDFLTEIDDAHQVKEVAEKVSSRSLQIDKSGWSDDDDDDDDDYNYVNNYNDCSFEPYNSAKCEMSMRSAKTRLRSLLCLLSNNFGEVFMKQELLISTLQRLCAQPSCD